MRRPAAGQRLLHIVRLVRQVFGAPDYEAYLEHCQTAGHQPLGEREYVAQFFESKGKGARCC